jgi:D-alanyl-D-alanine carboxypeptidase
MLRTIGESRGFRIVVVGFLVGVAALALAVDSADARSRRRSKKTSSYNPPYSAIVVDANSGKVLHASEADGIRHPASLTKIMTLYLLFERLEAGKVKPDTLLKVSAHAAAQSPTKLSLKAGDTIKVEDAILGLVTKSANDAAVVIAEALAGDEEEFAKLMTRKARALGMSHTVYKNASGLPDRDQVTTARDQALLGRAIQDRFPRYYRYFSTKSFTFHGKKMGNHNHLLGSMPGVDGIKTGYIDASGFNLVASMKRNNRHLVAVVLGGSSSSARDARMRSLLEKYVVEASASRTAPMIAESGDGGEIGPVSVTSAGDAAAPAPAKPISSSRTELKAGHTAKAAASAVDPIKPNAVRTIKVKLNGVHSASLTPPLAHLPVIAVKDDTAAAQRLIKSPQTVAIKETPVSQPAAAEPAKSAVPSATPAHAAAAAEPQQAAAAPIQVASAEHTIAIPAAAPAPAEAPHKVVRTGWMIQVGAFEAERDARDRLSSAQNKAKRLLAHADPFTETVEKDNRTFYRARFAGFAKGEAEAACKYLRRNDFACFTLKN